MHNINDYCPAVLFCKEWDIRDSVGQLPSKRHCQGRSNPKLYRANKTV